MDIETLILIYISLAYVYFCRGMLVCVHLVLSNCITCTGLWVTTTAKSQTKAVPSSQDPQCCPFIATLTLVLYPIFPFYPLMRAITNLFLIAIIL